MRCAVRVPGQAEREKRLHTHQRFTQRPQAVERTVERTGEWSGFEKAGRGEEGEAGWLKEKGRCFAVFVWGCCCRNVASVSGIMKVASLLLASGAATATASKMEALTSFHLKDDLLQIGSLNISTGVYTWTPDAGIQLPKHDGCEWAIQGTEGRGTATFHSNRSFFFLAQQTCASSNNDVSINQTILSHSPLAWFYDGEEFIYNTTDPFDKAGRSNPDEVRNASIIKSFPGADYNLSLDHWNLAWDHACNLITIAPRETNSSRFFETWMISEYDGQARPQKKAAVEEPRDGDWHRSKGSMGALDGYGVTVGGPYEANCGANCSFFSVEASAAHPENSRIVGRNFHTGKVLSNISNTVDIRTLTSPSEWWGTAYNNFVMLGLGVCHGNSTDVSDMADYCMQARDGDIVLVAYGGSGKGRAALTPLVTVSSTDDPSSKDTLRLGVVALGPYEVGGVSPGDRYTGPGDLWTQSRSLQAYFFANKAIRQYQVFMRTST